MQKLLSSINVPAGDDNGDFVVELKKPEIKPSRTLDRDNGTENYRLVIGATNACQNKPHFDTIEENARLNISITVIRISKNSNMK